MYVLMYVCMYVYIYYYILSIYMPHSISLLHLFPSSMFGCNSKVTSHQHRHQVAHPICQRSKHMKPHQSHQRSVCWIPTSHARTRGCLSRAFKPYAPASLSHIYDLPVLQRSLLHEGFIRTQSLCNRCDTNGSYRF